MVQYNVMSKMK